MDDPASEVRRVYIIRFCQLAASLAALYDHVLTFNDEIRYVWKREWTITKYLFLTNRYLGCAMLLANAIVFMSDNISENFCYVYNRIQALTSVALILIVQGIMQYRLYAIYQRSRTLALSLGALWTAEIVGLAVVLGLVASEGVGATTYIPGTSLGICTPQGVPDYFYTLWIPVMVFESVMFGLAAYRGYSHIVEFAKYGDWWCPAMLSGVLVRDSIVYFSFNFSAYLLAALLWAFLPHSYIEVSEGFTVGITCVMGARMILNLREAYERAPTVSVFSTSVEGMADIGWAPDAEYDGDPPSAGEDAEGGAPVVRPVWWMKPPETRRQCVATNARGASEKPPACPYVVDATYTPRPPPRWLPSALQRAAPPPAAPAVVQAPARVPARAGAPRGRPPYRAHLPRRGAKESMPQFARPAHLTGTLGSVDLELGAGGAGGAVGAGEGPAADRAGDARVEKSAKAKGKARAPPSLRSFGSVVSSVGAAVRGSFGRVVLRGETFEGEAPAGPSGVRRSSASLPRSPGSPTTPATATTLAPASPMTPTTPHSATPLLRVRTDLRASPDGRPAPAPAPRTAWKKSEETLLGTPATLRAGRRRSVGSDAGSSAASSSAGGAGRGGGAAEGDGEDGRARSGTF